MLRTRTQQLEKKDSSATAFADTAGTTHVLKCAAVVMSFLSRSTEDAAAETPMTRAGRFAVEEGSCQSLSTEDAAAETPMTRVGKSAAVAESCPSLSTHDAAAEAPTTRVGKSVAAV